MDEHDGAVPTAPADQVGWSPGVIPRAPVGRCCLVVCGVAIDLPLMVPVAEALVHQAEVMLTPRGLFLVASQQAPRSAWRMLDGQGEADAMTPSQVGARPSGAVYSELLLKLERYECGLGHCSNSMSTGWLVPGTLETGRWAVEFDCPEHGLYSVYGGDLDPLIQQVLEQHQRHGKVDKP